ncbi:PAS domain-containing protein [Massilia sp. 2TAF26]|uniref:PAS domain-containing protein n=1 Tax=Massilia sp. 2TAF26 TaxID=3233012 RepID=UPI003F94D214
MTENSFAFRLKELLEHKNLTLQAVATVLGVSRPAVHKWTKGGEIDYEKLRKLAAFLGVNWVWLRYGEQAQHEMESATTVDLPMTDVRRRYTAEVVANEARMKLAQEGARIVTWEWDLITDDVKYSSNVESVYGWQVESNETFYTHVHPDDIPMMQRIYEESIRLGSPHEFDFRLIQPDGTVRWISSRATPVREFDGRVIKFVGISMENTAQKLVEQSLREERARCRAVLELSAGCMALLDADLRCESVNDALAAWLGWPKAELEGEALLKLFTDGGARLRRSARAKSPSPFETVLQDSRGEALPAQVRVTAGRRDDGGPAWVVVAIQPL